jgi:phosphatidate phosphatase APP1
MTNVHGIQQPTSVSNGTTTTATATPTTTTVATNNNNNQIINTGIKRPLTNGNNTVRLKQTPQVQLRVTCQVCKKV